MGQALYRERFVVLQGLPEHRMKALFVSVFLVGCASQPMPQMEAHGPESLLIRPPDVLPSSTGLDPKLTAGVIEIDVSRTVHGLGFNRASSPVSLPNQHYLPMFSKQGSSYVSIPYAVAEDHRNVTLDNFGKVSKIELPVTKSFGPSVRKSSTATTGPFVVTVNFNPWRYTTEPLWFRVRVEKKGNGPRLVFFRKRPKPNEKYYISNVRMIEGDYEPEMSAGRFTPDNELDLEIYDLEAVPIRLRPEGSSYVPTEYFLPDGTKVYSRWHRMTAASKFEVVKVSNIYISNHGIRNRPPGDAPSYAMLPKGKFFDAVGYRLKSPKPYRATLKLDLPSPLPPIYGERPTEVFISPR